MESEFFFIIVEVSVVRTSAMIQDFIAKTWLYEIHVLFV